MQRDAESIDRKNGGSSGEMGRLGNRRSTQDELKDGKRKEREEKRKRGPRCRNVTSKRSNEQKQETDRASSLHRPFHHTIPNTKKVYKAKPTHVATQRTQRVKGEHGAMDHVTTLWTKHQRA